MVSTLQKSYTHRFLDHVREAAPIYYHNIEETHLRNSALFTSLAERMLGWAEHILGPEYLQVLTDGYIAFVNDVNTSQVEYEKRGHYQYSSYDEVFRKTYDSPDFMNLYHWGVYVTTFAWEHHLLINDFFHRNFLSKFSDVESGHLIDLGCGSGIWSLLSLTAQPLWKSTMVDISSTTVELTHQTLTTLGYANRCDLIEDDATSFQPNSACDAGISCFLLEHLEHPESLLRNLAAAIPVHGYAFVTTALTAAETDHIYEFRRESEVVALAEETGFRVEAILSVAPQAVRKNSNFLPRSIALVLQKRQNEIW